MPNCVTYVPGMLCNLCVGKLIIHVLISSRPGDAYSHGAFHGGSAWVPNSEGGVEPQVTDRVG